MDYLLVRWQTQLRRDPRHAYLRMNWRRSVEPVEFVRRPRRDSALYKVDRPMDRVFIRRTSSWYVHLDSASYFPVSIDQSIFNRNNWCDICHVRSAECQVPLDKKLIFFTHIERVLGVKCESLERSRVLEERPIMYTNPFNRKHSTIRQMLDRLLDPTKKAIRRSESVSSSSSNDSSKDSYGSFGRYYSLTHSHRGKIPWGRK